MFHVTVLAAGRLKEKYLVQGAAEYLKRLNAHARVDVVEVDDGGFTESLAPSSREKIKEKEGLNKLALNGRGDITFVIGGSLGLSRGILDRAAMRLSFSKFTFPHQLMRLILLEQIYRWFKINRGEPYHK